MVLDEPPTNIILPSIHDGLQVVLILSNRSSYLPEKG